MALSQVLGCDSLNHAPLMGLERFLYLMYFVMISGTTNKSSSVHLKINQLPCKRIVSGYYPKTYPKFHGQVFGKLTFYSILFLYNSCTVSFHGARLASSSSDIFLLGHRSSKNFRYSYRFKAYAFAISTIVKYKLFAVAPFGVSENSQFLRPTVTGLMQLSLRLLLKLQCP